MLRRGFKSQCERRAVELRKDLELRPFDPLSAEVVGTRMGVTIWSAEAINGVPADEFAQLVTVGADEWSGFTIRKGIKHLVVINPSQSPRRKNSVLMHELAHIMLGHDLEDATVADTGELLPSTYNADQEDEAAWLGATLLLPRPAMLWMRFRRLTNEEASNHFGVSSHLLTWRLRMTGVDYQLKHKNQ